MKKIINWFKDLFYNATDYAIILCVVAVVAVVLFWRFDILFNLKLEKDTLKSNPISISDNDTKKPDLENDNTDNNPSDENNQGNEDNTDDDNGQVVGDNNSPTPNNDTPDNTTGQNSDTIADGEEISFNVPEGSFPGKIADILIDKSLISDKQTFLNRSMELKLDTKLKSGDFKIKKGTSLDDVIKIIAKQK